MNQHHAFLADRRSAAAQAAAECKGRQHREAMNALQNATHALLRQEIADRKREKKQAAKPAPAAADMFAMMEAAP